MAGPVQSGAKARDSARIGPWRRGRHGCREVSVAAAHQITVVEPVVPVGECPRRNFTRDIGFVPVFDQGAVPGFGRSGPYSTPDLGAMPGFGRSGHRIRTGILGAVPAFGRDLRQRILWNATGNLERAQKSASPRAIWRLAAQARLARRHGAAATLGRTGPPGPGPLAGANGRPLSPAPIAPESRLDRQARSPAQWSAAVPSGSVART